MLLSAQLHLLNEIVIAISVMPDSDEHANDIYEDEEVELSDDDPPAPGTEVTFNQGRLISSKKVAPILVLTYFPPICEYLDNFLLNIIFKLFLYFSIKQNTNWNYFSLNN